MSKVFLDHRTSGVAQRLEAQLRRKRWFSRYVSGRRKMTLLSTLAGQRTLRLLELVPGNTF